jgi:hypothetical protein
MIKTHYSTNQGKLIPLTEKEEIPSAFYHHRKRIGDIVLRKSTGIPLIICGYDTLDDGSGSWSYTFFNDPAYEVIGNIFEDGIALLLPYLKTQGRKFDYESYGLKP